MAACGLEVRYGLKREGAAPEKEQANDPNEKEGGAVHPGGNGDARGNLGMQKMCST